MDTIIKQSYGIDISKLDFSVCLSSKLSTGKLLFSQVEKFSNDRQGFNQFLKWSRKVGSSTAVTIFVMEATGIYYEGLAYHLDKLKKSVSVILPNKVKYFAKSLNIISKNDSLDSRVLAHFGHERQLSLWHSPSSIFKELRDLTRLCSDLKKERTVFSNRNEIVKYGVNIHPLIKKTNSSLLKELEKQIEKCEYAIHKVLYREQWLSDKVNKLLSIKGIGISSIATILAETQGFSLISSRKQLASYAGYDVIERQSGTSIKGRTRISKRGNSRIRACMHFPAMVASRFNADLKEDYLRIIENKPSKMIGMTALQRKLLLLVYTLWKKDEYYLVPQERTSGNHETKLLLRS